MKNRRILKDKNLLYANEDLKITLKNELSMEIIPYNYITSDVAEMVALLLNFSYKINPLIWNFEVKENSHYYVSPESALFVLTGGDEEWNSGVYKHDWIDVYEIYLHEYENLIFHIVKEAKTLSDIKKEFKEQLNREMLYEFALEHNFINI